MTFSRSAHRLATTFSPHPNRSRYADDGSRAACPTPECGGGFYI